MKRKTSRREIRAESDESSTEVRYLDLPSEVLVSIFEYLNKRELISISKTCKYLRSLSSANFLWKKFIDSKDGMDFYFVRGNKELELSSRVSEKKEEREDQKTIREVYFEELKMRYDFKKDVKSKEKQIWDTNDLKGSWYYYIFSTGVFVGILMALVSLSLAIQFFPEWYVYLACILSIVLVYFPFTLLFLGKLALDVLTIQKRYNSFRELKSKNLFQEFGLPDLSLSLIFSIITVVLSLVFPMMIIFCLSLRGLIPTMTFTYSFTPFYIVVLCYACYNLFLLSGLIVSCYKSEGMKRTDDYSPQKSEPGISHFLIPTIIASVLNFVVFFAAFQVLFVSMYLDGYFESNMFNVFIPTWVFFCVVALFLPFCFCGCFSSRRIEKLYKKEKVRKAGDKLAYKYLRNFWFFFLALISTSTCWVVLSIVTSPVLLTSVLFVFFYFFSVNLFFCFIPLFVMCIVAGLFAFVVIRLVVIENLREYVVIKKNRVNYHYYYI